MKPVLKAQFFVSHHMYTSCAQPNSTAQFFDDQILCARPLHTTEVHTPHTLHTHYTHHPPISTHVVTSRPLVFAAGPLLLQLPAATETYPSALCKHPAYTPFSHTLFKHRTHPPYTRRSSLLALSTLTSAISYFSPRRRLTEQERQPRSPSATRFARVR